MTSILSLEKKIGSQICSHDSVVFHTFLVTEMLCCKPLHQTLFCVNLCHLLQDAFSIRHVIFSYAIFSFQEYVVQYLFIMYYLYRSQLQECFIPKGKSILQVLHINPTVAYPWPIVNIYWKANSVCFTPC